MCGGRENKEHNNMEEKNSIIVTEQQGNIFYVVSGKSEILPSAMRQSENILQSLTAKSENIVNALRAKSPIRHIWTHVARLSSRKSFSYCSIRENKD